MNDVELIQRISEKDKTAFRMLYHRYSKYVFNLSKRLAGNKQEAEDITQEVFMRVWKYAYSFNKEKIGIIPWLSRICYNAAYDVMKKRGKGNIDFDEVEFAVGDLSTEKKLQIMVLRDTLKRAFNKLPKEQQTVIQLVYLDGLKQKEVAERLGIPLNTVKSRLRLGLKRLRQELKEVDDGHE